MFPEFTNCEIALAVENEDISPSFDVDGSLKTEVDRKRSDNVIAVISLDTVPEKKLRNIARMKIGLIFELSYDA